MKETNRDKDQQLDKLLQARPAPMASGDLLARLKDVPANHAQPQMRLANDDRSILAQFRDLFRLMSPLQLATQSGAMAMALVLGVWLGMADPSSAVASEVDVAQWLGEGDLDIYEEEIDE